MFNLKFKEILNKYQELFFTLFIYISYILIIFSFFDLSNKASQYLINLDYYVRIYVCLFLIWRFNPLREIDSFTNLDRKIAFSAGLFILTTTFLNKYILLVKNLLLHSNNL